MCILQNCSRNRKYSIFFPNKLIFMFFVITLVIGKLIVSRSILQFLLSGKLFFNIFSSSSYRSFALFNLTLLLIKLPKIEEKNMTNTTMLRIIFHFQLSVHNAYWIQTKPFYTLYLPNYLHKTVACRKIK